MNVSVAEAKAKLSELLKLAEAGEEITVTRHGRPIATIAAATKPVERKSLLGAMKGQIWISDDFDELGPEWDEYIK